MQQRKFGMTIAALMIAASAGPALAGRCQFVGVEGGEVEVNTDNGAETAGKTGLLKCYRDGKLWREQELRDGAYIGLDRSYADDGSISERQVNANGNTEGVKREFWPGGQLRSEANHVDGDVLGLSRSFHRNGKPAALRFGAGRGKPSGSVIEYNESGQITELRCASTSSFDEDRAPCGRDGKPATVELFDRRGSKRGELVHREGSVLAATSFDEAGKRVEASEFTANGRIDRRYFGDGKMASERRIENDYAVADSEWYMNGQLKQRTTREPVDRDGASTVERYRDSGVLQSREYWRGRHREREESFDEAGKRSLERSFDEDGNLSRQRKFAADGSVLEDESFYPDGSRK